MKKIIHTDTSRIGQLHCDACGYDLPEPLNAEQVLSGELLGHPCPCCGANMLTQQDWEAAVRMFRVFAWINRWFGWLGHEEPPAEAEAVGVRLHAGKVIVERKSRNRRSDAVTMRPDLKAMIERGARGLDAAMLAWKAANGGDDACCVDMPDEEVAEACLRSALPGLFTEPPECWVAPWECPIGSEITHLVYEEVRDAVVAKRGEQSP